MLSRSLVHISVEIAGVIRPQGVVPKYKITTRERNFTKSLVYHLVSFRRASRLVILTISFKHGMRVPKYRFKLNSEKIRGTRKSASKPRTSYARSIVSVDAVVKPTIPSPVLEAAIPRS